MSYIDHILWMQYMFLLKYYLHVFKRTVATVFCMASALKIQFKDILIAYEYAPAQIEHMKLVVFYPAKLSACSVRTQDGVEVYCMPYCMAYRILHRRLAFLRCMPNTFNIKLK